VVCRSGPGVIVVHTGALVITGVTAEVEVIAEELLKERPFFCIRYANLMIKYFKETLLTYYREPCQSLTLTATSEKQHEAQKQIPHYLRV
jgi:hypothetical protein